MKKLIISLILFVLLSLVAPIRLKTTIPQQCGYNGSSQTATDETCIADCTLCNTTTSVNTHIYPLIIAYIVDAKDRNNGQTASIYKSEIVRNEIIIVIVSMGFGLVMCRTRKLK
jgi:hypothetical protein